MEVSGLTEEKLPGGGNHMYEVRSPMKSLRFLFHSQANKLAYQRTMNAEKGSEKRVMQTP